MNNPSKLDGQRDEAAQQMPSIGNETLPAFEAFMAQREAVRVATSQILGKKR